MVENVARIKKGITLNVGVKNHVCEKTILRMLQHSVAKMVNMQEVLLTIQ